MSRAAFAPIFEGNVAETLRAALQAAEEDTIQYLFDRRTQCLDYYHNEVILEDGGENKYLKNHSGYQPKDGNWIYKKTLLLEHVNLTEQIIDLKSRNYREQPLRLVNGDEAEKYQDLLKRSKWFPVSKRVEQYANLLSDIAVGVFFNEETSLLQFQVITEYYPIFSEDDPVQIDPVGIIHPTAKRDQKTGGVIWAYYDKDSTADINELGEVIGEVRRNSYGVFNFLFPHRKHPVISHFSTPATALIDANQAVDAAVTSLNQALHYNAHKQMVMKGKVSKENAAGQEIQFALGNAQVITIEPVVGAETSSDVQVIDMQVDFEQMYGAIRSKMELVANSYNVQFQWKIEGGPQSGYSLDVQNARDYEDRRFQFEVLEDYVEQPLFEIVTKMSERYPIEIEEGELSIDFVEPKSEQSVQDKVAWQRWMRESGEWDLKKQIMENNPDMEESEAEELALEMEEKKRKAQEEFNQNKEGQDGDKGNGSANGDESRNEAVGRVQKKQGA